MRRLEPGSAVSAYEAFRVDPGTPWTRAIFVRTLNGAATDETGWTDSLGGAEDLELLSAARAHADAVLVGAGTIRTGRMPPVRKLHRSAPSRSAPPQLVVVSASLELDWTLPVLTESARPPIVLTSEASAAGRLVGSGCRIVTAGRDRVDLSGAMRQLREEFELPRILCEGGSTLLNGLLDAELVDELLLTLAPHAVPAPPRVETGPAQRHEFELAEVYAAESVLFTRYRRPGR